MQNVYIVNVYIPCHAYIYEQFGKSHECTQSKECFDFILCPEIFGNESCNKSVLQDRPAKHAILQLRHNYINFYGYVIIEDSQ